MKNFITRNNPLTIVLIMLLIANIDVSTISNNTITALVLKFISSAVLLLILFIHAQQKNILIISFLTSKEIKHIAFIMMLIILYLTLTLIYSSNPVYGFQKILNIVISVIPNVIAVYYLLSENREEIISKTVLISSFIIAILLILVLILQPFDQSTIYEFSSGRWSHVIIGRMTAFLTLIILFFVLTQNDFKKIIGYSIIYGAGVYLTFLTGLRSAFLGLILFSLITIIVKIIYSFHIPRIIQSTVEGHPSRFGKLSSISNLSGLSRRYKVMTEVSNEDGLTITPQPLTIIHQPLIILLTLIMVFILTLFAPEGFQSGKRLGNLTKIEKLEFGGDQAIQTRLSAYELSIDIAKDHPLFGIGFGGFNGYNNLEWTRIIKYSHNIILEILCELGIVGLLLFSVLFFVLIKSLLTSDFSLLTNPSLLTSRNYMLIAFFFSLFLAMFSKDISTQGFLWLFVAAYSFKGIAHKR